MFKKGDLVRLADNEQNRRAGTGMKHRIGELAVLKQQVSRTHIEVTFLSSGVTMVLYVTRFEKAEEGQLS